MNRNSHLQEITADLFQPGRMPSFMIGWVNGNDYETTNETFGILPLSDVTRAKLQMLPYNPQLARDLKIRHQHLAQEQKTQFAVLPIHTPEEQALYRTLAKRPDGLFAGKTQPNWVAVAQDWARFCDGIYIFYKVSPFLASYSSSMSSLLTHSLLSFRSISRTITRSGTNIATRRTQWNSASATSTHSRCCLSHRQQPSRPFQLKTVQHWTNKLMHSASASSRMGKMRCLSGTSISHSDALV